MTEDTPLAIPVPHGAEPVGTLVHDGHETLVWALSATVEGKVIVLNATGSDVGLSATIKRLLRKDGGKVRFSPADGQPWSASTDLIRLPDHYDTVTAALTHQGIRLKNMAILPDGLNIAVGLARPQETMPEEGAATAAADEGEDASPRVMERSGTQCRYLLGDLSAERAPAGALCAQLRSLVVVCHPVWEPVVWEASLRAGLLLPQPSLGIRAWSLPADHARWTALMGDLWRAGRLPRPEVVPLTTDGARRRHRRAATGSTRR